MPSVPHRLYYNIVFLAKQLPEENTSQTQAAPEPVKNLETDNEHLDDKVTRL